jgi:Zn-dependent protease
VTDDAWPPPTEPWEPAGPAEPVAPWHEGAAPSPPDDGTSVKARVKKFFAPLAGVGAFLAKFGAVLIKLKSVVFLGSAAVSVLAYAQLWGWRFGLGFVVLLLVHELGHVGALRLRGIRSSALVFVPMLGALTAWKPQPRTAYEDAETALAGPVVGAAGSLLLGYWAHHIGSGLLMSLAFTGLILNLFNLAPVRPLDGGKVVDLLYPWIWGIGILGLLAYELYRPGAIALVLLLLAGYQLYHQVQDRDGHYARAAAAVQPWQRARISTAYLVLLAVMLIGLHATYVQRHLS